MRLSRIKLAGFKSFVDPTDLQLRSSLVGIVGPNGCGKSNTIDAVRWVMGESSAKHLRGESMDDVIFTGSSSRKPVNQASVELVFDNSDGSLGGEYASFSEISLRREVSRDGQSKYSLNNVRCRRRDIRDIFLGTGLGPRSYAIIEQGMISRLIESKPEEMRVYLEEAAGISKYKERRRETETRIRHTRDNLDRLSDLREEVDKQLERLKRQVGTAERFQGMQTEVRQKRGELLVLRQRDFQTQRDKRSLVISERESKLEGVVAELRAAEAAIEQARVQQSESAEIFSTVQADFYRIGADVSRIEQSIEHTRDTRRQQSRELDEVMRSLEEAQSHQREDTRQIADIVAAIKTDEPAFARLQESQEEATAALHEAESRLEECQERKAEFARQHAEVMQAAQVERSRIESLERSSANAETRLAKLTQEQSGLDTTSLASLIVTAVAEEASAAAEERRLQQSLAQSAEKQQVLRDDIRQLSERLNKNRAEMQSALGRLASLEALQQSALTPANTAADEWLQMNELADAPRLAQLITAEPGWEKAVELVLGSQLEAVCVDGDAVLNRCLNELPAARLALIERVPANQAAVESLAAKVSGDAPFDDLFAGIYAAADLPAALALRAGLAAGESVVTPDGLWLGRHWLRVARAEVEDSVLLRETEITALRTQLAEAETVLTRDEQKLAEVEQRQSEHETRRDTLLHGFNDAVRLLSTVKSGLQGNRQRLEQVESRRAQLQTELIEVQAHGTQEGEALTDAKRKRATAMEQSAELNVEGESLQLEQEDRRTVLTEVRARVNAERQAGQELAIRVESMRSARTATEQNLVRMQAQITQLGERQSALNAMLANQDEDPLIAMEAGLKEQLNARLTSEAALKQAREQLDAIETRLREHEQARHRHDTAAQSEREAVQSERMASQEVLVRLKTLDEQLAEQEYDAAALLESLDDAAEVDTWSVDVEKLEQRIQRLGPINLAALDEQTEQLQRKEYLDGQNDDVNEALATLERAIAKIDRETRARFKDTFDRVNVKFEEFFPRLFGGGHASLEMTGDDLLNTGVSVVAQPPGKRVSSIQLLSGGEKALTAVALVFAFFELNPSPFCMLDEVDAPLDDANVGRFCTLVKEMSERVQFIFITHNKVTMEMSEQLMGVTMNEPGVSRLVAVDVQEAVELAGV
ncbi:MAG: chromosome segregation protein SMC [Granulosicoccus sp.]